MRLSRLTAAERRVIDDLRDNVLAARRWHHSRIVQLDALWPGVQSGMSAMSAERRAARIASTRATLARLTREVPATAFGPDTEADVAMSAEAANDIAR